MLRRNGIVDHFDIMGLRPACVERIALILTRFRRGEVRERLKRSASKADMP